MKVKLYSTDYKIDNSDHADSPMTCWLTVYPDGYCELKTWTIQGKHFHSRPYRPSDPADQPLINTRLEVWEILSEVLELVELQPIGPEDKEYFTTDTFNEAVKNNANV